jgi:acetyltransferase-like isoleucine patch superfamily enzyme
LRIRFQKTDFVTRVTTEIDSALLETNHQQVRLTLSKNDAASDAITAAFAYVDDGIVGVETTFAATVDIFHGENHTRAEFRSQSPDTDADIIPDDDDNCPTVFNPGQEQTGNNVGGAFGDACVSPDVTIPGNATVEPGAVIESGAELNNNVTVMAGAVVKAGATLNQKSTVEANAVIGEESVLNRDSIVREGAIIGKNVSLERGVEVRREANVGDNSVVGRDSTISEFAVVGCFAAPTSFAPLCPGAALGANLGRNVTVQPAAFVADGAIIPKNTSVP